ncbi:MAG: hypothetical protein ACRDSR_24650 [Pseudonocardiaceae bacterium]
MSSGASVSPLDAHVITTEADGRLRGISPQRAREIINAAIVHGNVVAHFHGGLISEEKGRKIAERLLPLYTDAGAYPLFFVWRSGLQETLPGNLTEIVQDELVDRLLRQLMRWTVGRLRQERAGGPTARPLHQVLPAREEVAAQMRRRDAGEEPFAEGKAPEQLDDPELSTEEQTMFRQELIADPGLREAVTNVITSERLGSGPTPLPRISQKPHRIARAVLADVVPGLAKGLSDPAALVRALAEKVVPVLGAVLRRYRDQVDHGVYPSVLEEFLRVFLLGELGGTIWRTIKKDTQDTFEEPDRAGRLFVEALVVAGVLEREGDDSAYTPLVGLARYLAPPDTLSRLLTSSRAERAKLVRVRSFFAHPDRIVLSPSETDAPEGRQAAALKHGDFDDDPMVLRSLATILKQELVKRP